MVKSLAHYVGYGASQARQLHDAPNRAGVEQNHSVTLRSEMADSTIFFSKKPHVQQQRGYFELELEQVNPILNKFKFSRLVELYNFVKNGCTF
jgi:hypothetical protein